MREHRDAFLDSLTEEEKKIHEEQCDKGLWEKIASVLNSKDPEKAAAELEKEMEEKNA